MSNHPPVPADLPQGFLYEMAFLIDRGTRPLALISGVPLEVDKSRARESFEAMRKACAGLNVAWRKIETTGDYVEYIVAANTVVADAYEEMMSGDFVSEASMHVLRGLLLGYSGEAVSRWVDEMRRDQEEGLDSQDG